MRAPPLGDFEWLEELLSLVTNCNGPRASARPLSCEPIFLGTAVPLKGWWLGLCFSPDKGSEDDEAS